MRGWSGAVIDLPEVRTRQRQTPIDTVARLWLHAPPQGGLRQASLDTSAADATNDRICNGAPEVERIVAPKAL
jgi:hypothetical protein